MTPRAQGPELLDQNARTNRRLRRLVTFAIVLFLTLNGGVAATMGYVAVQNHAMAAHGVDLSAEAVRQATTNNRDILRYRRDFAQSRDCPVEYFRRLVEASRAQADIAAVEPPCQAEDLSVLDAKIAEVEKRLAALDHP